MTAASFMYLVSEGLMFKLEIEKNARILIARDLAKVGLIRL